MGGVHGMLDLVVEGGKIIDGTGAKAFNADIGIKDGLIVSIGNIDQPAKEYLHASGAVVTPGFIDIHSHSDLSSIILKKSAQSKIFQGVTTEIVGNCGISCLPVNDESRERLTEFFKTSLQMPLFEGKLIDDDLNSYSQHLKECPPFSNIGLLVGHGTLRGCVVGMGLEAATAQQIKDMCLILERELKSGAFGMSLGLIYPPSSYGTKDELIALAKVLKKYNAMLTVHLRSESTGLFQAVDEMFDIARASNVHVEISHLKLIGKAQWGKSDLLLKKIKDACKDGLNITCDQYPYEATSTGLSALVPAWAHAGGATAMCKRLEIADDKLMREISDELERRGGADSVLVVSTHGAYPNFDGLYLKEISSLMHLDENKCVSQLLVDSKGWVSCCYFSLSKEDVLAIMKEKNIIVGSDGYAYSYNKDIFPASPHPRNFGTFPRFFQVVRENKLMNLEAAVFKATGLVADTIGMKTRGRLKVGKVADLVVFNEKKIMDNCTYRDSLKLPSGIKAVIVSGKLIVSNNKIVEEPCGKLVKHDVN